MNQHERVSKTSRRVCIQTRIININERAHPCFFLEALLVVQNYSRVPDLKSKTKSHYSSASADEEFIAMAFVTP